MSGKFINTDQKNMINSTINNFVDNILNNPLYTVNQNKPTIVTYYNMNKEKSTLDKSLQIEYNTVGQDSPIYYNKINGLFIYGFQRIDLNMDEGEFGEEAESIIGESYILSGTIEPYPGDHFVVDHLKEPLLFKVIEVQYDTLDNGSNSYKISYKLTSTHYSEISMNIADEYEFLVENVGTNNKSVIKKSHYKELEKIDIVLSKLRTYYKDLFFNSRVQTFTFRYNGVDFYDGFLIEFLKKSDIINNDSRGRKDYVYVNHSMPLDKKFNILYDSSIFKAVEVCNKDILYLANLYPYGKYINDESTIFNRRYEDYFSMTYDQGTIFTDLNINIFKDSLVSKIRENDIEDCSIYETILVKYFNNNSDIIKELDKLIEYANIDETVYFFYMIPFVIYCIEKRARNLLS